uniref:G_PROTEIN_RECEP_F1_2 domain-containing protein n=1 Tax=Panagrellus redivivus TaxID=6233 RepID=A0A7E4V192_PANRE
MTSSSGELTFYESHINDRGVLLTETLPGLVIRLVLQVLGLWGNLSVAYVTYKHKHLRTTCGILLSICVIADAVHESSHDFFAYLIFTKINFTSLRTCVLVNILPIIGLNTGCILTLCLAIDRLICVLFPIASRRISKYTFVAFYCFINFCVSAWIMLEVYFSYSKLDPNQEIICLISDAMPGSSGSTWFLMSLITGAMTVVCYIAVWVMLRVKSSQKNSTTKRMFKSLFTLGLIVFCTWMVNGAGNMYLTWTGADPVTHWRVSYDIGVAVNVACSANYYVLLLLSNDYRNAFKAQLNINSSSIFVPSRASQTIAPIGSKIRLPTM